MYRSQLASSSGNNLAPADRKTVALSKSTKTLLFPYSQHKSRVHVFIGMKNLVQLQ